LSAWFIGMDDQAMPNTRKWNQPVDSRMSMAAAPIADAVNHKCFVNGSTVRVSSL
jgi:hypothetical protein